MGACNDNNERDSHTFEIQTDVVGKWEKKEKQEVKERNMVGDTRGRKHFDLLAFLMRQDKVLFYFVGRLHAIICCFWVFIIEVKKQRSICLMPHQLPNFLDIATF